MNAAQLRQLRAQLKVLAQLNLCGATNTNELDRASGLEPQGPPRQLSIPNSRHTFSSWRNCPAAPHHRHIDCPVGDFDNADIPMALLAQERDNYIVLKMQTHLRRLRVLVKNKKLTDRERQKFEFMEHILFMNSRQRYVRDLFYNSYTRFVAGKPLKSKEISAIIKLKRLSVQERKKGFVIKGHSFNNFMWQTGEEFTPETPFQTLPRYAIRDRQKNNSAMDLKQTLPVVASVLSTSASLMVASHAYNFFAESRQKMAQSRLIAQQLDKIWLKKDAENMERFRCLTATDEEFARFWNAVSENCQVPSFTHGIRLYNQPSYLEGCVLHQHQIEGMSWLIHLYDHHVNAILADEVGLGKSLQVIAFLAWLREQKHISGPHVICMPASVVGTWRDEFAKWMPAANVVVYVGKKQPRRNLFENRIQHSEFDVMLTPYSILEKDKDLLSKIPWHVMVFDEGHKLKNSKTQLFGVIDEMFFPDFRILTTATPFQNEIGELWALLYLISPHTFCAVSVFNDFFQDLESSGNTERREKIIQRMHQMLRPYILRRIKNDLDFDIPKKLEIVLKCSPSELQSKIVDRSTKMNLTTNNKLVLSRKVSNCPALFLPKSIISTISPAYVLSRSPKLRLLDKLVQKLNVTGHKFLIYSQWTSVLDIIERQMQWRNVKVLRIDGRVFTRRRLAIIDTFTAPGNQYSGMLLSTRSSAFGLNLQVADTVILFDSDYNPFVELQASARVHRLGQKNIVVVIRLLMQGTGEEKILSVARRKFLLGNEIIDGGGFNFKVTDEERAQVLDELSEKPPEIVDPDDDQLNSVIARSPEELSLMEFFAGSAAPVIDDEDTFESLDLDVETAFIGSAMEQFIESGSDEWEEMENA